MNLYFRMLALFLRLLWLPKTTDLLAKINLNLRVWPFDLDLNGHVNNGRYLTMFDLGRLQLMGQLSLLKPILKHRWSPVVGSAKVHFLRSLKLFDKFTITTRLIYWDEKWIYLEQQIMKGEQICVSAIFKGLFISKEGLITPQQVLALIHWDKPSPSIPEHIRRWQEVENNATN